MSFTSRIAAAAARGYGMFRLAAGAVVDPFFNYVIALLHGDGTNGAQNNTFLDSSTNNFTITRNGNTTQGTFSPFSQTGWSYWFDGNGDYVSFGSNVNTNPASSDFTVEAWIYPLAYNSYGPVFSNDINAGFIFGKLASGFGIRQFGVGDVVFTATTPPLNQWMHVAATRSGTSWYLFYNGTIVATATASNSFTQGTACVGGDASTATEAWNGYLSNVRFIKGTALYTSNFTPSTAPLTAVSGTQLLTCQSNRFLDNSSNAYAATAGGSASVQAFSPFNPTSAWSASSNGGSAYFDGSGDYLTFPNSSAFAFGTGAFTIEGWVNSNALNDAFIMSGRAGIGTLHITYGGFGGTTPGCLRYVGSSTITSGTVLISNNAWNHFAVVRDGSNNITLYVNGVSVGTGTDTTNYTTTSGTWYINANDSGPTAGGAGYISNLRIVKGTQVYTTAFTPPTSPLTAITNTSFLMSATNAGIYDNAAVGDYETVGNAQVSTSVKKYGTGSMAFQNQSTYVKNVPPTKLTLGDNFTIEGWVYITAAATTSNNYTDVWQLTFGSKYILLEKWRSGISNNLLARYYDGTTASDITATYNSNFTADSWFHVAYVKLGTTATFYLNGLKLGTSTISATDSLSQYVIGGGSDNTTPTTPQWYVDDFRITKYARYLYNFTLPTAAFPNIGGALTADPYFNYTTLLLPGNGTNGAQNNTFLDSSSNAFTITRNGNTTQGNFSPFSQTGWSNNFASGNYLSAASNAAFAPGTGDFTVEAWINHTSAYTTYNYILGVASTGGLVFYIVGGVLAVRAYNVGDQLTSTYSPPLNQWMHVAAVRSGTTLTIYANGTAVASTTNSYNFAQGGAVVGNDGTNAAPWYGYISNLRMVKGTAVYTGNFTPPTAPLTAITNTSLLTCQSNRFIDNSANAFALTVTGSPSVQAFSPFAPTAAWSASTNGGSGYFDGSGDYLTVPDNAAFDFGSGDFTISAWVYPQGAGAIIDQGGGGASSNRSFEIYMSSASAISNAYISSDGNYNASYNLTGTTVPNAWNFVEFTRSSGTIRLFVNGTLQSSAAANFTIFNSTATVAIGNTSQNTVNPFTGYIADVRVLKGTGSASSTVPTAPLTAISGTSLLLSATNGGITDATAKNDLETVGNAQISTTQSRFGGSSMYFDGSGDRLTIPFTNDFLELGINGQNFTVEAWIYPTNTMASVGQMLSKGGGTASWSTTNGAQYQWGISSSAAYWSWNSSGSALQITNGNVTLNAWQHLAVTYDGTTTRTFLNGVLQATSTSPYTAPTTRNVQYIGMTQSGGYTQEFYGYIDDLRITKGIARYTSNFTPPTSAFLLQ